MSAPVAGGGVLGRLASIAVRYDEWEPIHDAVAELIAADKEYDEAVAAWEAEEIDPRPLRDRFLAAKARRAAALSNIEGAST